MNAICPQCREGKHPNCDGMALDEKTDQFVDCQCRICEEARNG